MSITTITWQEALATVEKLSWPDQLRLVAELLLRMEQKATANEPVDLLELAGVLISARLATKKERKDYEENVHT